MKKEIESAIESMKGMMQSCFAYKNLFKGNSYLRKYKEILGDELFNEVYDEHSNYLSNTFRIESDVYTDHEGCTYNSLVKI